MGVEQGHGQQLEAGGRGWVWGPIEDDRFKFSCDKDEWYVYVRSDERVKLFWKLQKKWRGREE